MRRLISIALMLILAISIGGLTYAEGNIQVYVDNKIVDFTGDVSPFIENGRTFVPMRKTFETLGATVEWNDTEKSVVISKGEKTVTLTIDRNTYQANGLDKDMDTGVTPKITNGRTVLPARYVAEALGYVVTWDGNRKIVAINAPDVPYVAPVLPVGNWMWDGKLVAIDPDALVQSGTGAILPPRTTSKEAYGIGNPVWMSISREQVFYGRTKAYFHVLIKSLDDVKYNSIEMLITKNYDKKVASDVVNYIKSNVSKDNAVDTYIKASGGRVWVEVWGDGGQLTLNFE